LRVLISCVSSFEYAVCLHEAERSWVAVEEYSVSYWMAWGRTQEEQKEQEKQEQEKQENSNQTQVRPSR